MNKTDHQQRNKTREQQRSQLSPALVMLLACAAGLSVANVYYAQPLLDLIAQDFKLDYLWVGLVVSLTQVGSIIALIFIVPLGDLLPRKSLMLFQSIIFMPSFNLVGFFRSYFHVVIEYADCGHVGHSDDPRLNCLCISFGRC